jgi:D-glycero-alpha-D-manno-heptose 1-phosphate guanylyltransferase
MGISTAIILAGGLGTRLRSAVPDLPKCMAPVAGRPFISYVIDDCVQQGITNFILSLGYKSEVITEFITTEYPGLNVQYAIEAEPLGTGGGIKLACSKIKDKTVLVVNGDTLFKADLRELHSFHLLNKADCTLVLKPMENFDRYGVVELNQDFSVISFKEKQFYQKGNINGGVYMLNTDELIQGNFPDKFSFEKDYLEKYVGKRRIFGFVQNKYFIDIGIPEDFEKANKDLSAASVSKFNFRKINKDYTLFLDRDGVINEEVVGDYIRNWNEFIFRPGSLEAIALLTPLFQRIVIVTNQRGVGKGLMTLDELNFINQNMMKEIEAAGGKIDKVYYCTSTDNQDINRKPNPGMAMQAKADFPEINLSNSVMVGNMPNDMLFGRNIGAMTIYLPTRAEENPEPSLVDAVYNSLLSFAKDLTAHH